ncbi:25348_t:CDS:2, partial [Racocetra persica]
MYNHEQEINDSNSEFSEDELEVYFLQNHHNEYLIDSFPVNPKYPAQESDEESDLQNNLSVIPAVDTIRNQGKAEDNHADQELIVVPFIAAWNSNPLMLFYEFFSIESLRQIVESTNKYSAIQNSK